MNDWYRDVSRRRFLQVSAVAGAAVALGGVAAACTTGASKKTGTFNWMTWSDHYYDTQLDDIKKAVDIGTNISELADNAEGFAKLKEVTGQLDMLSGDALWVPKNFDEGLVEAFDINSLAVSKQLYSIAREFEIWTKPAGYLGYPFGWSPIQIAYNPKFVSPAPDSWEVLLDPKYKGRIVVENQPVEVVAYMAKLAGIKDPYNMTDAELAQAKEALLRLKPNILKFAQQNTDTVAALVSEEAWLATSNLGAEDRVKDAGGSDVVTFIPKEGTIGWMDAEMIVKGGKNHDLIMPFLELAEQKEYIAENFIKYGRPLFNEGAYKILVDKGEQERADRYLYNKPETVLTMTLKGPGVSTDAAIRVFNEVFGA